MKTPLALLLLAATLAPAAGERPPNLVYILADDLGIGDIGPYGQEIIATPALDRMAAQGMRFTRHYSGSNVCAPTRCALITGKHTGRCVIRGNRQAPDAEGQYPLPADEVTVAELLQDAGYATGMFGKWGLGNPGTSGDPLKQGFDTYFGYTDQIRAHNYFPDFLLRDGERVPLDNEVTYLPEDEWHGGIGSYSTVQNTYSHDLIEEAALDFIRSHRDQPFFLYLPVTLPHDNGEAPELRMEVPDFGRYADKDWGINHKGYAEMVTRLDATTGKVIALLEELDLAGDTLVIFTSDNGAMKPAGKPDLRFSEFFDSNGPFRGYKRDIHEGGIRAPMIAWWPGTVAGGGESDHVSAHWDLLATACELAGTEPSANHTGISFLPTLLGRPERQRRHEFLYFEDGRDGDHAVIQWPWKGLRRNLDDNPDAPWEIYHLERDPGESRNLAAEQPERIERFAALVQQARTPSKLFPLPLDPN